MVEIECVPKTVSTVSNCIPSSRSVFHAYHTFFFIWDRVHANIACILWGMAKISFLLFMLFMYLLCTPRFQSVYPVCIPKTKKCVSRVDVDTH